MRMPLSPRKAGGFTLIELMITVAIIAVLTAIAMPSYLGYVRKANRSAAQSYMMSAAARQEQALVDQRSYVAVTSNANFANLPSASSNPGLSYAVPPDVSARYNLTVALNAACPSGTAVAYCFTATPTGSQQTDGTLYLASTGAKSPPDKWK